MGKAGYAKSPLHCAKGGAEVDLISILAGADHRVPYCGAVCATPRFPPEYGIYT